MKPFFIAFLSLVSLPLLAQKGSISGTLTDTSRISDFEDASILLLRKSDNTLLSFTRSNAGGQFRFNDLDSGSYKIIASNPEFADMVDFVDLKPNESQNLEALNMIQSYELMKAIVIRAKRAAIQMKGDTVIYVADSFKTFEGATVEDLLRKLPGVQVDRSGNIVAQGKDVDRVLVDGEEFFGDDATIATKNLNAKDVDAVKVYDAQSDDAKAAGDGETLKVMDIRLKDNAKKGWIAKVTAGGARGENHDFLYDGKIFVNHFRKKERFGVYAITANSPEVNISWREKREFTNSINSSFSSEGFSTTFTKSDFDYWLGYSQGLPKGNTTYGYYQNKFHNNKISLNINGGYKELLLDTRTSNRRKSLLESNSLDRLDSNVVSNFKNRADFGISTEIQLDTFTNIGISFKANQDRLKNESSQEYSSFSGDGRSLNSQSSKSKVNGQSESVSLSIFLRKKFEKENQYFGANFSYGIKNNEDSTDFESTVRTFVDTGAQRNQWTQKKDFKGKADNLSARVFYNHPLSKEVFISASTTTNIENMESEKFTFNENSFSYIDSLSSISDYSVLRMVNSTGINWLRNKIRFKIGLNHNFISLNQKEQIRGIDFTQDPINTFVPTMEFNYKYYTQGNLNIKYSSNVTTPSINQIQPIIDNINPINLNIGNVNLKNSLTHNVRLRLFDNRTFKSRYIFGNLRFFATQDAFVSKVNYDEFGRSVNQTVNGNGVYGFNGNFNYYKNFGKLPLSIRMGYRPSYDRFVNFINDVENTTNSWSHNINPGIDLDFGKYGLNFSYTYNFSKSTASVFKEFENENVMQSWDLELFYENPKVVDLEVEMTQNIRPTNAVFKQNSNSFIVSASAARYLDKKRKVKFKLGVYDLFNQNIGYSRNVYQNTISENTYNIFTQYFYARLSWRFSRLGSNQDNTSTRRGMSTTSKSKPNKKPVKKSGRMKGMHK